MPLEDRTRPSSRRFNWQEKLADEKKLRGKEQRKGRRSSSRGTQAKRYGTFREDREKTFWTLRSFAFPLLHGKLVVHSKRALNTRIFPPWTTFSTQSFHSAVRCRCSRSLMIRWKITSNLLAEKKSHVLQSRSALISLPTDPVQLSVVVKKSS